MKTEILQTFDQMIRNGEKITYRKLGEKLGTVASTITYQFGSKDELIKAYFDSKFTAAYREQTINSFTDLLVFSCQTNYRLFQLLEDDISLHALIAIHSELLTKHYNNYQQLYIDQYGKENDPDMIMKMSYIHMIAINPQFYQNLHSIDIEDKERLYKFFKNIT